MKLWLIKKLLRLLWYDYRASMSAENEIYIRSGNHDYQYESQKWRNKAEIVHNAEKMMELL